MQHTFICWLGLPGSMEAYGHVQHIFAFHLSYDRYWDIVASTEMFGSVFYTTKSLPDLTCNDDSLV